MSKKQIDRIRALEAQIATLQAQVAELQARPPIVINNPAPQMVVIRPDGNQWDWHQPYTLRPTTICDSGGVGIGGYAPTVTIGQNVAH